jgi:signal transduction histidine kinase
LAKRSNMDISFEISFSDRLPADLELALFRVLQESLTNIHRHSGSSSASIRCDRSDGVVGMTIRDAGKGIAPEILQRYQKDGVATGVGLAGMRERIRELGGKLQIDSSSNGTQVSVSVPDRAPHETSQKSAV